LIDRHRNQSGAQPSATRPVINRAELLPGPIHPFPTARHPMDLRDIRTLILLSEFKDGNQPTQRELAAKLDISLGLVNLYLKQLAQKSYFKIKTYPKNRVSYLLTPKGILEKSRLTCEYIHYSLEFYARIRKKLKSALEKLEAQGVRTMAFYGANEIAEIAYLSLKETRIELTAVIDDAKNGENFMGYTIIPVALIGSISFDRLLDNTISTGDGENDASQLMQIPRNKILSAIGDYTFLKPVGPTSQGLMKTLADADALA
jgi:DNA-binding MarR family transcriptional regulator